MSIDSFLVPYFKKLNENKLSWAVARGWEGLPYCTGHDIDIYIAPVDVERAVTLAKETCNEGPWRFFVLCRKVIYTSFLVMRRLPDGGFKFIQFDLFSGAVMKGRVNNVNPVKWLSTRRDDGNGIWHIDIGQAAAVVLRKELSQNGVINKESRKQQLRNAASGSESVFRNTLIEMLKDETLVSELVQRIKAEDWDALSKMAKQVRAHDPRWTFSDIWTSLRWAVASLRVRFRPFFRFFIVFIGPDGCGKTTIADAVEDYLTNNPFSNIYRIHGNFKCMPRLRNVYRAALKLFGKDVQFAPDPTPGTRGMGMQAPLGRLRTIFYITYYGISMVLSRIALFRMYPYYTCILADRYFYDYYYMRGYLRCPQWYKRLWGMLIPCPDMILYLERSAEEIYSQKPELDVDEIKRQQKAIRKNLGGNGRFHLVDASHGISATVATVLSLVGDCMEKAKKPNG